ncbi:MAG: methyltransferase domain-containing protein [Nitrospinota bacterium]
MSEISAFDPDRYKAFERDGWRRSSGEYHDLFGSGTAQAAGPLLDAVNAEAGTRLLDVACGPGIVSGAAAARGCSVLGLDFATGMLAQARERYPEIEFREGDAEDLPLKDASFEAVVCNFGMNHIPRAERAVAGVFRVLSPGGRYAFTTWSPGSAQYRLVNEAVQAHGDPDVPLPEGPDRTLFSDPGLCKALLAGAGFEDAEVAEIPIVLKCTGPEHLIDIIYKSTVRTRALLEAQSLPARGKINRAIAEAARGFEKDGTLEIPMPAVMVSARKP